MAHFLGLPAEVRAKIMGSAGLTRSCKISFLKERERIEGIPRSARNNYCGLTCAHDTGPESRPHPCEDAISYCEHEAIPTSLLLVNRQVHHEALKIIYARNCFSLDCQDLFAVDILRNMNSLARQYITNLHIALDGGSGTSIRRANLTPNVPGSHIPRPEQLALGKRNPRFERSLARFRKICVLLADSRKAGTLKLTISCNVKSLELGKAIMECLRELPPLKDFSIDLGPYFSVRHHHFDPPEFRTFRKEVALEVRRLTEPAAFRFDRLPGELQAMIFSHVASTIRPTTISLSPHEFYNESGCCGKCTFLSFQLRKCFCRARKSRWSSTCACPIGNSLFGINRSIREQMLRTVYSKNRFMLWGSCRADCSSMPFARAYYVRDLTIDLEVAEMYSMDSQSMGTLELVARTFRLELLDLKIRPWADHEDPYAESERYMDNAVKNLIAGLRPLGCVRSFTVLPSRGGWPLPTNDAGNLFGPEPVLACY